jgi:hypothetical protein
MSTTESNDANPDPQEQLFKRITRYLNGQFETHLADRGPDVWYIENLDTGTVHMAVPEQSRCSCEDHIYRNTICKHLCAVLDASSGSLRQFAENNLMPEQVSKLQFTDDAQSGSDGAVDVSEMAETKLVAVNQNE